MPALVDVPTGQVVTNDFPWLTHDLFHEWRDFHRADAPDLSAAHLRAAAAALATHDAALGPAVDGGYWLLALASPMPFLFDAVAWGTDAVCATTRERLAAHGRRWVELETLADLDRPQDLARWPSL